MVAPWVLDEGCASPFRTASSHHLRFYRFFEYDCLLPYSKSIKPVFWMEMPAPISVDFQNLIASNSQAQTAPKTILSSNSYVRI